MMAAHGWDEDQRGRWPGPLRIRVMLDIVSTTYSEPLNPDPTREYIYD